MFDTLLDAAGKPIDGQPLRTRRRVLQKLAAKLPEGVSLTEGTEDLRVARRWLKTGYAGTDGVIAKRLDLPYRFGERAMLKVKRIRTADCVVGGFRYGQGSNVIGSLLLGLYDDQGLLHHVGFTSALANIDKPALTTKLEKLVAPPGFTGDAPGGPSRWATAALCRVAALEAKARGRSELRSRDGRPISAWHETAALAAGQGAQPMHFRPDQLGQPLDRGAGQGGSGGNPSASLTGANDRRWAAQAPSFFNAA